MNEIIKDIAGYPGSTISNFGIVRNKNGVRKTYVSRDYEKVILTKNNKSTLFSVHRIVAQAFIQNNENKPFVNHKNGIKTDNHTDNLEWCTRSENTLHAYKLGLCKRDSGVDSAYSKVVNKIDPQTNIVIEQYLGVAETQRKLGYSNISRAIKQNTIANGYKWCYA